MLHSKKATLILILFPVFALCAGSATASMMPLVMLNISPMAQNHAAGDAFTADVIVSGLEYIDLASFNIDVIYDPAVIAFHGYDLGNALGHVDGMDANDRSLGGSISGKVNIAERSNLCDFSDQASAFSLVTLSFTGLAQGITMLSIENTFLDDIDGNAIDVLASVSGYVQISSVPAPAAVWLFVTGLASLIAAKRFRR